MNNYIKKLSKNLVFLNRLDTDKEIVITVDSTIKECICPQCGKLSNSVQAKYIKKFQDLPIDGKTVYIKINNRVFNCINNECDLDMFSEQYDFVDFKKNKTKRLFKHILDVSSTTSNRKAEKILKDEGIVVGKSAIALLLAENKSN